MPFLQASSPFSTSRKIKFVGISGSYVDDMVQSGTSGFVNPASRIHQRFEMTEDDSLPSKCTGFQLSKPSFILKFLQLNQSHYLDNINPLPLDEKFSNLRSDRRKITWLSYFHPDFLFEVSQFTQVAGQQLLDTTRKIFKHLNFICDYSRKNPGGVLVPPIYIESLRVIGLYDASFANNTYLSTQIGYIIFLADKFNNSTLIHFKSYKARRVVWSFLRGKLIYFSDMFSIAD